jgi:hypothetical protein
VKLKLIIKLKPDSDPRKNCECFSQIIKNRKNGECFSQIIKNRENGECFSQIIRNSVDVVVDAAILSRQPHQLSLKVQRTCLVAEKVV